MAYLYDLKSHTSILTKGMLKMARYQTRQRVLGSNRDAIGETLLIILSSHDPSISNTIS